MPRYRQPTKDVQVCDNLRGVDKTPIEAQESEWGNPLEFKLQNPQMNQ